MAMAITPVYSKPKSDRVSVGRLLLGLRPFTPISDLLTGVVERREVDTYNPSLIKGWVKDSKGVFFKVSTRYWGGRAPPNQQAAVHGYVKGYLIEGSADEIVNSIEDIRGWPANGYGVSTQYLRYRDGKVKLTVTGGPEHTSWME